MARSASPSAARVWHGVMMLALVVSSVACSSPAPGLTCVDKLDVSCAPLYPPDFDHVYTNTLHPTCAQVGSSCHSAQGRKHGLVFEDPDQAYGLLLGTIDGRARVDPADPRCSILIERIMNNGVYGMPPGRPLSASERCAIVQWVVDGAMR